MKLRLLLIFAVVFFMSACTTASGINNTAPVIESAVAVEEAAFVENNVPEPPSLTATPKPPKPVDNTAKPAVTNAPVPVASSTPKPTDRPRPTETPEITVTPEPATTPVFTPFPEVPEDERPMIALTFDDGPSNNITPQILALLEEYNAKATFCVIGYELEKRMDIGKMIFESGNEIVSHTWSHKYLTRISEDDIRQQLQDTNALIEQITGTVPVFYRPPYGDVNDTVRSVSEELGLSLLMWSIDPKDWKFKEDTATSYAVITEHVKAGSIILCHDIYDSTLELVEMVLSNLSKSYRFVTVSELFEGTEIEPGKIYRKA